MYAKTLIPGPPMATPSLTATSSEVERLRPQLLDHGWNSYGAGPIPQPPTSWLEIGVDQRLRVIVGGNVLLDDENPVAPDGWWEASQAIGGRCVVVILRSSDVDLTKPDAGLTMRRLLDDPQSGAWAVLPVTHPA